MYKRIRNGTTTEKDASKFLALIPTLIGVGVIIAVVIQLLAK